MVAMVIVRAARVVKAIVIVAVIDVVILSNPLSTPMFVQVVIKF